MANSCFLYDSHAAAPAPSGTIRDIKHVVIFMQENRSFDHYYGALRGVRGFADQNAVLLPNGRTTFHQPRNNGELLPLRLESQCVSDTAHDWESGHAAWNFGNWDRWVFAKGIETMTYYTRAELPFHYALADAYTVCDAYHCSVIGPTNPNRLYLWSGTIDPRGTAGGPVIDNSEPFPGFRWTTYPERLQAAGVTWKIYQEFDNYDDNALAWFAVFQNSQPGEPLYDRGLATVGDLVGAFHSDVMSDTLPAVSWIIAPTVLSEHPPFLPSSGADLTKQLLDSLAANPDVFKSTAFILTYDENDGFFDHVPAPVPFPRTADEFVKSQPIGLGVRVPTVIVSPWTRGGYVCSEVFDHTSILRFLENWTGVQEPNISAWRRQVCGDLTSAFDFNNPDYTYPILPLVLPFDCLGESPSIPAVQTMPVQESGIRPARHLPYQPNATSSNDCANGRLYVQMTNAGSASVHFVVYANAYQTNLPRQFDVAAGASAVSSFDLRAMGNGNYDYTCYGPNGFQRRFAGSTQENCGTVDVTSVIDPSSGLLTFVMRNSSEASATFTIRANAYRDDGPLIQTLPANSTALAPFPVVAAADGWYDFTATTSDDPLFMRRFAGRVEPSNASPLKLTFSITDGKLSLSWTNKLSTKLQTSPDLKAGSWVTLVLPTGQNSFIAPIGGSAAFFRLTE